MNYLARLAAQTGLTGPLAPVPSLPAGFEVVDEVVLAQPVAPAAAVETRYEVLPVVVETEGERIVEKVVLDPPRVSASAVASRPAPALPVETAPRPVAAPLPENPGKNQPEARQRPEELRELRLRQVLEWVALNDRPAAAAEPEAPPVEAVPTRPAPPVPAAPSAAAPRPGALPELEIPLPRSPTRSEPLSPPRPATIVPATAPLPERRPMATRTETDSRVIEEHIDISIGTIRLDVRPPVPAAGGPKSPAPPPPAPLPRSAGPATTASRLRRRYIRL